MNQSTTSIRFAPAAFPVTPSGLAKSLLPLRGKPALRLMLVLGCLASTSALAQHGCPIVTANTGQPGWTLVSGPGVTKPKPAVAMSPKGGWGVMPDSQWISVNANHAPPGDYTFEYQFTACPCRVQSFSLAYLADNSATVSLNGAELDKSTGNTNFKGSPRQVNFGGPFAAGVNRLRVVVHNDGLYTGLDATLRIDGAVASGACPCTTTLTASTGQPGWMITSGPGVTKPKPPVLVSPYPGWSLLPDSSWVSVDADRGSNPGNYNYEYTFCKCGPGPMALRLYADNGATVSLNNGSSIFASAGDTNFKGAPLPVNYDGSFAPGTNKVRITVRNDGHRTGLDAVLTVAGATAGRCATLSGLDPTLSDQ